MYQQDINNTMQPNIMRLILMGIASLLLCLSFVMSVFTPFPLAMGVIVFGRAKGYAMISSFWLLSVFISASVFGDFTLLTFYTGSIVLATVIAEIVLRKKNPLTSMVTSGLTFVAAISLLFALGISNSEKTVKEIIVSELEKSGEALELQKEKLKNQETASEESFKMLAMLNQPELLADEVIKQAPSYFFIAVFLMIWVNLFLCLKINRMMFPIRGAYTELDLINFKVPEHFIWPVIISLALSIWGSELGNEWYSEIGITTLKCLGIFYFFQGFGIYLDFLNFIKLGGFLRTLLVMFTVLTASQLLALVGLFDMFINFRKFFRKTN